MAERKATNKYYPPDWDPSKGSLNKHKKSHPLRDRARKIDEGILVVRFEMPFNVWCLGCGRHIAMGVRYNAEKKKVGNYYTSPVYQFKMKCHLCDTYFTIQTDPSKFDYVVLSGARRQVQQTGDEEDISCRLSVDSEAESRKKMVGAMFRLEKRVEDKIKSESQLPSLNDLKNWRSKWEDSFAANQLIRSQFRQRRKRIQEAKERDKNLLNKTSLKIQLVKPSPVDKAIAKKMLGQIMVDKLKTSETVQKSEILNTNKFIPRALKQERKMDKKPRADTGRLRIKKEG